MDATIAEAVIGPTPEMIASRRLASLSLCQARIAASIAPTRLPSASNSATSPLSACPWRSFDDRDFGTSMP
ncbi:hypothetical protein [Siccirubricoccus sp. G192]|uniref:hypothetical protein n=1 Tax=Siccirubricoccus sp. G192 TaxID=2849651 RepID=UPI0020C2E39A|nr:hypothetical protein [Siccirubricoccus sp. G192]